ncbi:putative endonuclease [Aromatoleum aromaticum EbN1]|uniref:Endonuclease n=1 Tax=Aromatoleum aromaticum (strain DSM 19018 / LMG 30748 / EbN1) TaxID=76114 RepID=Q5NYV5_AROAE|nr:restriction endonuclease [Aromatoleum aromaticum]CAI09759.1 putative endonuclease [Aromatoleum aromaticum EbN1]
MGRRRYRRKTEGLLDIAVRSDWKISAGLAAASVFGGAMLVPAFLAGSPALLPIGTVFTQLAWLVAFIFAFIAVIRFVKQAPALGAASPLQRSASRPRSAGAERPYARRREPPEPAEPDPTAATPSPQDGAWIPSIASGAPLRPPRPDAWSLDVLDRVEWKRFEDLCCAFYREKGIRAETTRLGADGGIDIHLFQDDTDPTRATAIVQCKAWNKPVGVKEVRELRGVMAHEKVDKAFFMAPNGYTDDARAFATENHITLLDGKLFLAMLQRLPEDASRRLLEFVTEGDWTTPTCPSCGVKMMTRDNKRGTFWACPAYPKCKGKLPMRASARR